MTDLTTRFLVGAFCCLFILLGVGLIPYVGIQNDEALFANPLYQLSSKDFTIRMFHHQIVLMVMSYIGTLKTLLYVPIFAVFGVSVWSVRLPMVLAGALTIWIFFHLTLRAAGRPVALLAAALLATDPVFLVTNTIDWGPVALEHLLLVTGCLFFVCFGQDGRRRDLAFGFFFLGLALWNKAIFLWALAGLVSGALAVFWPEVRRAMRRRNATWAAAALLLGAMPFVIYNIHRPNATLHSSAHLDPANWRVKLWAARITINGSTMLGFIPAEDEADNGKTLSRRGSAALWIRSHLGEHRQNGMEAAFVLALLAVPLWWRSRTARFALVFLAVAWALMIFTRDAGGSAHHTVLLWPFPQLFVAAVFGSLRWRPALLAGVVLVGMNLLVVNQHLLQLDRNGAAGTFTDAIYGLSDTLRVPPDQPIYILDWGMLNTLALFHQGHLLLRAADPFLTDTPSDFDRRALAIMLSDPGALFVGHVLSREVIPGVNQRLDQATQAAGRQKELIRTISDSNGHPVFEIFRLRAGTGK